eukprot:scaffold112800_cov40-Cyclotella_meneghiniana.AAC.1
MSEQVFVADFSSASGVTTKRKARQFKKSKRRRQCLSWTWSLVGLATVYYLPYCSWRQQTQLSPFPIPLLELIAAECNWLTQMRSSSITLLLIPTPLINGFVVHNARTRQTSIPSYPTLLFNQEEDE